MPTVSSRATQEFVPIKEVRDGIIVLKDGSLRSIVLASSVNFSLKSEDERQATLLEFQNFLNSLEFSVQIFIESRKLDIRPYIALLEQQEKNQMNDLMRIQVREYIDFIKNFTESTNIMSKNFFVVIPYTPPIISSGKKGSGGIMASIIPNKNSNSVALPEDVFEEYRSQLEQRISIVEEGLVRCGVRVVELGTEEIVELFYKIFNPGEAEKPIQLEKPVK